MRRPHGWALARIRRRAVVTTGLLAVVGVSACATTAVDYSAFRAHEPKSILVLPPLNESIAVEAPYTYLSTVSMPLGEAGYYVFPVAVVDAFMKDNGLPNPAEMHSVPLAKLSGVFGADAVLYVTIREWGQKFHLISSDTVVSAVARLVDVDTATVLWTGQIRLVQGSGGSGDLLTDLITAVVEQIIDSKTDVAHGLSRQASKAMFLSRERGLPYGWRHPLYANDQRGR